jgi:O-antigen/teichoic acid export membrane protein
MKSNNKNLDNSLKLLAKSAIVVLFAIMVSKVLTYAYKIIIARYFGIEAYGLFSLATNIADLFVIVSSLGFGVGILRYVAWYRGENKPEKIRFIVKKTLIFLLITSIIAASILFIFSTSISLKIFH